MGPTPKLMLIPGIATMDMVLVTIVTTVDHTMVVTTGHTDMDTGEEKRGKQKLNPQLLLKLMLILTIVPMVMALDTMDTTDLPMDMDIEDIGEKRKGKPKLIPMLRPMLTPGTAIMDMAWVTMDTDHTTDHTIGLMDMDIGVERRGKLKLSLRL